MKIESELFFPWLQRLLPAAALPLMIEIVQDQDNVKALSSQVGSLCKSLSGSSNDLNVIKKIGLKVREIKRSYLKIQSVQVSKRICSSRILSVWSEHDLNIDFSRFFKETIFVPYITAYISKKEQERFNRGVISNLGFIKAQVLPSCIRILRMVIEEWNLILISKILLFIANLPRQVHLCGMIEAIKDQPSEMSLLRSQIPSIAQATLPVWKKRVYDPKTACLNFATWWERLEVCLTSDISVPGIHLN